MREGLSSMQRALQSLRRIQGFVHCMIAVGDRMMGFRIAGFVVRVLGIRLERIEVVVHQPCSLGLDGSVEEGSLGCTQVREA
jgi:hypothetical protein